ncbi:hypothetical protein ACTXT7_004404, partial [Hymenolepis weldensis]
DNCTVTVPGRCKLIDSQLRQSCLGTPLPYEYTSNRPIIDDVAHFDIQSWATLKAVPMCWDKLQNKLEVNLDLFIFGRVRIPILYH